MALDAGITTMIDNSYNNPTPEAPGRRTARGRMSTKDPLNWRFSKMTRRAGIGHWHAHEGRHTAGSIMSSKGVPLQDIGDTVGHKSTDVTDTVYRHVIVPAKIRASLT